MSLRRVLYGSLFWALLLGIPSRPARANILDVGGNHYGTMTFEWIGTFQTSAQYALFRLPTPSVWTRSSRTNIFVPLNWAIQVYDAAFQTPVWFNTFVNEGFTNSATFVQVNNPNPGTPFSFYIYFTGEGVGVCDAFGLEGDLFNFGYNTTYYTQGTDLIDAGSPSIQSALSTALGDGRWSSGVVAGNRGDLERISLKMTDLGPLGRNINRTDRTASQVWANGFGDCDDMVKLECALLRRYGVPARVNLTVYFGEPPSPFEENNQKTFHATGEYWNGEDWESFEPRFSVNFMEADNFVLGSDQDFTFLYPTKIQEGPWPPFAWPAEEFTPNATNFVNGGSMFTRHERPFSTDYDIAAQEIDGSVQHLITDPGDDLGDLGSLLSVRDHVRQSGTRRMRVESPSRGSARVQLDASWEGECRLIAHDLLGRSVRSTVGIVPRGGGGVSLDMEGLPSGLYFLVAEGRPGRAEGRCVLLRR
jgi:hypothetical protein